MFSFSLKKAETREAERNLVKHETIIFSKASFQWALVTNCANVCKVHSRCIYGEIVKSRIRY